MFFILLRNISLRNILSCNYEITLVIQLQLNRFGKRAPMDRSTMVRFGRAPMDRSTMVRLVKLPPLIVSCVELYYRFGKRAPLERSSMVRFGKRAPMDRASMVRIFQNNTTHEVWKSFLTRNYSKNSKIFRFGKRDASEELAEEHLETTLH
ncbi:unnamed protein product [Heligmosomoides polygyrus]|uniref:Uncharacterized protein n=1 Tax=Heligmosomoides polygyrus TaxID=6339 RepID=A0A183FDE1_HELPZ|nr:unnamed protein product [Heligmosomoides polygyrus]